MFRPFTAHPRFRQGMWLAVTVAGLLAIFLALNSYGKMQKYQYVLHNFSGKLIVAATVSNSNGMLAISKKGIADTDADELTVTASIRPGALITVQWLVGPGRARWLQATLPSDYPAGARLLHIYLHHDRHVCVSPMDQSTAPANPPVGSSFAPVCELALELAPLSAGTASTLKQQAISRKHFNYEHSNNSPEVSYTLNHQSGNVSFNGVEEFPAARMIGKQAAWLVKTTIPGSESGAFLVSADVLTWHSRYLGHIEDIRETAGSRLILEGFQGPTMIVNDKLADVFVLPGTPNREYWIVGLSSDGNHAALAVASRQQELQKFTLAMLELDTGIIRGMGISLPDLPRDGSIEKFYVDWVRGHCRWTPILTC